MATLSTMQTNVGYNVNDTDATLATKIGIWLNQRYFQILRAINWQYINEDYTITTISGTQDYVLPSDFYKEIYVTNTTDENELAYVELQDLAKNYPGDLTTQGNIERYTIFNSDDGSKYIRFHYVPDAAITINFPYMAKATALTSSTSPVIDFADLMITGATADTWRYKRQFQKAKDYELLFAKNLQEHIWDNENQPNRVRQFIPQTFDRGDLY